MQTYDNLENQLTVKDQEMLSLLTAAVNGIIEWRTTDHQANFKYWELYGKLAYLWIELEKYMNNHLKEQPEAKP